MPTSQNDNPEQAMYQAVESPSAGTYPSAPGDIAGQAYDAGSTAENIAADAVCQNPCADAQGAGYGVPCGETVSEPGNSNAFGAAEQPAPGDGAPFGAPSGFAYPPPPPPRPVRFAGFFTRVAAFAVDMIACAVISATVSSPLTFIDIFSGGVFSRNVIFNYSLISILSYIITVAYFTVFTYFWDATPGKKLLNIKVITVDSDSRGARFIDLLFRESVGRFLSSLLCIGYIVGGLDKEKRCFHDMLSDTRVVYDFE